MRWFCQNLHEKYELVGEYDEDLCLAMLTLSDGEQEVTLKRRNVSVDTDSVIVDDLRKSFANHIRKASLWTSEQLELAIARR